MLVLSTFSVKMLPLGGVIRFSAPIKGQEALSFIRERAEELTPKGIGHPGMAQFLTKLLGRTVEVDRTPVALNKGDRGFIVLPQGRLDPGVELDDNELAKLVVVYPFEVLEG